MLMVLFLLGTLFAGGPPEEGEQTDEPAPRRLRATYLSLPGFWELRTENVQEELELSDEQKDQLRTIGREYYEQTRRDWAGVRGMSAEERKKKYAEIRQKNLERMKDIRKQVEAVLTGDQLERLKQINLRTRVLQNPRILDELGISEVQQRRLREIREQMQGRIRKLQQESLEKTLDVLTAEQREKLEKLTAEGFRVYGIRQAGGSR
jgi:Spy/CpxP family protein refolding chaperone